MAKNTDKILLTSNGTHQAKTQGILLFNLNLKNHRLASWDDVHRHETESSRNHFG